MVIQVDFDRINFNDLDFGDVSEEDMAKLEEYLKPIPCFKLHRADEYKSVPIDINGEANKEKLIDAASAGITCVPYYRTQAKNNPTYKKNIEGAPDVIYAREGVISLILQVNECLSPYGIETVLLDVHRSIPTQRALASSFQEVFFESMGCGLCDITEENKEQIYNKRAYYEKASKEFQLMYCSGVEGFSKDNVNSWPMHSTGGAIDLVLRDKKTGKIIDFGEGYFDNPSEVTHTRFYEENKNLTEEEKGHLKTRRLVYNVMNKFGAVNYGFECFHYSFQDQYWGLMNGVAAKYSYIQSPKDNTLSNMIGALLQKKQK